VEGLAAQEEYFSEERPWQPIVLNKASAEVLDKQLRTISMSLGWTGRSAWPSVSFMAKQSSLTSIYNFFYSATSKWVHFSPHILTRMGWGGSEEDNSLDTEWHFAKSNFAGYYAEFNRVYSAQLFARLLKGPANTLLDTQTEKAVNDLMEVIQSQLRWPELVTYEELNLEGPSTALRIVLRAATQMKDDKESAN